MRPTPVKWWYGGVVLCSAIVGQERKYIRIYLNGSDEVFSGSTSSWLQPQHRRARSFLQYLWQAGSLYIPVHKGGAGQRL